MNPNIKEGARFYAELVCTGFDEDGDPTFTFEAGGELMGDGEFYIGQNSATLDLLVPVADMSDQVKKQMGLATPDDIERFLS